MTRHRGFTVIHTTLRDKTAQIAAALSACADTEWVLVTDVDARTDADIIEQLLDVAALEPSTGVIGTPVQPHNAHPLERLHWRFADWLREHEFRCGSASIVAGPCYLARRELVAGMPPDTVADHVHVACRAMAAGLRVGFRRRVFLWRAALMIGAPVAAAAVCAAIVTAFNTGLFAAPQIIVPLLAALLALASSRGRYAAQFAALATILVCASVAALVTYPFSRQTASFPKVLDPAEIPSEPT